MATIEATKIVGTIVCPPGLALLPTGTPPKRAFLFSALVHTAAIFSVLTWLPILFPGRTISSGLTVADIIRDFDVQPLTLPPLPQIRNANSQGVLRSKSGTMVIQALNRKPVTGIANSNPPMPEFVSPQVIVSNFPDATNAVQTVGRPDLVAPPKLSYPMRLPSLVMLPPPPTPRRVLPQPEQPSVPNSEEPSSPLRASEPRVQVPALPMGTPKGSLTAPKLVEQPVVPNFQAPSSPFRANEPRLQVPVLPMGTPRGSLAAAKSVDQPVLPDVQGPSSPFRASGPRLQVPVLPLRAPKQ